MKTKAKSKRTSLDDELFKIFSDIFSEDVTYEEVREAKKAFSMIRQDVLYRSNDLLNKEEL